MAESSSGNGIPDGDEHRVRDDMFRLMRAAFEKLLSEEPVVRVIFTNHPLLDVPSGVRPGERETTIFEYGLNLPVPIYDLEIMEAGIGATLSFARVPRHTFVPWEAVVGILLPPQESVPPASPKTKPRPKLSLVP